MKSFFQNILKRSNNTCKFDYYKSIDFLPLFNFFMIHKTEDLRYLLKLEDYEVLPDNVELNNLPDIWEKILVEFQESEDGNRSVIQYVEGRAILKLELDYLILWNLYNLMSTIPDSKEILELKKEAGYSDKSIKWIEKQLKIINNKLRIKRKGIKEKEVKETAFDFLRLIDEIESIKGYVIDIHKTTVRKYIAIKKNIKAQTKAKNGRQNNAKGRNR